MADKAPKQQPFPPPTPKLKDVDIETVGYSIPSIIVLVIPILFIISVARKSNNQTIDNVAADSFGFAVFWALVLWFVVIVWSIFLPLIFNSVLGIRHFMAERKYKAEHKLWTAEQQRLHAIWQQEEAERRRLAEIEHEKRKKQQAKLAAEEAAQEAARIAFEAAERDYANAMAIRQASTARFLQALNAAYNNTKYEAALHGVTSPEDVLRLFIAGFPYLIPFKHNDAGLLRERLDEPLVAAIAHLLPPLPWRPSPPQRQATIAGESGQNVQARGAAHSSEQAQLDAAMQAYMSALGARRSRAAELYTALKEAYGLVQLEAELRDVTAPNDVLALFVEAFPTLQDFKHADAGLLRQWADDPLIDSIIDLLPPLPERPRKPRIVR